MQYTPDSMQTNFQFHWSDESIWEWTWWKQHHSQPAPIRTIFVHHITQLIELHLQVHVLTLDSFANLALQQFILPCPVLSCPVLSCPVLSCPVLSCRLEHIMLFSCLLVYSAILHILIYYSHTTTQLFSQILVESMHKIASIWEVSM